jgi:hypothetical protein
MLMGLYRSSFLLGRTAFAMIQGTIESPVETLSGLRFSREAILPKLLFVNSTIFYEIREQSSGFTIVHIAVSHCGALPFTQVNLRLTNSFAVAL